VAARPAFGCLEQLSSETRTLCCRADCLAAAVLPPPPVRPFTGDASPLVGTYKGPGRGKEMVIEVTQTPQAIAFTIDGAAAGPLGVEAWTFRQNQALLTFRPSTGSGQGRSGNSGPAMELRYDRGGGHFILKRQ
jgi:hypothetical protein